MKDKSRYIEIVMNAIKNDILITQEKLEEVINNESLPIDHRITTTRLYLVNINSLTQELELWISYMVVNPKEDNNKND